MIVKNEEAHLEEALKTVPATAELIVVDTGSTDRSKEIARSHGAQVYDYTWRNDFAAARNEALNYATRDYILVMDADERLQPDFMERVPAYLSSSSVYAVKIANIDRQTGERSVHRMVRMFPNKARYRFQGSVHEQLYDGDKPAAFQSADLVIDHYGYQEEGYEEKFNRYAPLYQAALAESPEDGYLHYQFGKLYYSMKQWEQACEHFSVCLDLNETNRLYFPPMLVLLAYALKEIGLVSEAVTLLQHFEAQYPDFPDLYFALAALAMEANIVGPIEPALQQALKIGETDKYTTIAGVGTYKAAYNLGLLYELTGRTKEATLCYNKSMSYGFQPAAERYKKLVKQF